VSCVKKNKGWGDDGKQRERGDKKVDREADPSAVKKSDTQTTDPSAVMLER
jgi:hypothetical protein